MRLRRITEQAFAGSCTHRLPAHEIAVAWFEADDRSSVGMVVRDERSGELVALTFRGVADAYVLHGRAPATELTLV
jgi:hypothetical protein